MAKAWRLCRIAELERDAGTPLFERHSRGVRPTAAGQTLYRHTLRILQIVYRDFDALTAASRRLIEQLTTARDAADAWGSGRS